MTPCCWPFSSIRRTSGTRMRSLMRVRSRSGGRRSNRFGTGTQVACGRVKRCESLSQGSTRASIAFGREPARECVHVRRALVARPVAAHRNRVGLGLAVADDEQVGDLAQLGVAHLAAHLLVALVDLG